MSAPVPTKLKLLRGNPGKRPIGDEPDPPVKLPAPPKVLDKEGVREWHRIGAELLELGLVSEIDLTSLTGYCQAWSDLVRARKHLKNDEDFVGQTSGGLAPSAWKRLSDEALKQLLRYISEFGLSPAARVRLATPKKKQGTDVDEFRRARAAKG